MDPHTGPEACCPSLVGGREAWGGVQSSVAFPGTVSASPTGSKATVQLSADQKQQAGTAVLEHGLHLKSCRQKRWGAAVSPRGFHAPPERESESGDPIKRAELFAPAGYLTLTGYVSSLWHNLGLELRSSRGLAVPED